MLELQNVLFDQNKMTQYLVVDQSKLAKGSVSQSFHIHLSSINLHFQATDVIFSHNSASGLLHGFLKVTNVTFFENIVQDDIMNIPPPNAVVTQWHAKYADLRFLNNTFGNGLSVIYHNSSSIFIVSFFSFCIDAPSFGYPD